MASFLRLLPLFIIFVSSVVLAAPAGQYNSRLGSKDFCVKLRNEAGTVVNDLCKDVRVSDGFFTKHSSGEYFLLRAGLASGGGTSMTTSQATPASVAYNYIRKAIGTDPNFANGTLANGERGQLLTIQITEVETGGTWTLTPTTSTGFTSLIFESVGDIVTLLYVNDTIGWVLTNKGSVQTVD